MGNLSSVSLDTVNDAHDDLALGAVAQYMSLTQQQVLDLRNNCQMGSLGQKRTRPKVSRASFQKALMRSRVTDPDCNVFHQLFIMWDEQGEERVDFVEFLSGTSVLACGDCKSLQQVLLFALEVMDTHNTKHVSSEQLERLLNGINATAAYFGDMVLSPMQVQVIVDSVFLSLEPNSKGDISHDECAEMLERHPMVLQFVAGLGQYKFIGNTIQKYNSDYQHDDERDDHIEQHGSVIVGAVRDLNGNITSKEIGTSSSSGEHNEI